MPSPFTDPSGNRVLIRHEHPKSAYAARVLRRRAFAFMEALGLRDAELSITLTGDGRIAEINGEWRHKPVPTDVLSFPAGEMPRVPGVPMPVGDIVISLDTAARRVAEGEGETLASEISRYLAHGLLHLTGWDHATPGEARAMLQEEERLLGSIGKGMLNGSEELFGA